MTSASAAPPAYRQRIGYHAGLLGLFALLASAALMLSYQATSKDIAQRAKEDLKATLSKVIPADLHDNDMAADKIQIGAPNLLSANDAIDIYLARRRQQPVAAAYQVIAPDGYSGAIVLMLGVDMQGKLLGVRVISHAETPGLGDKIEIKKDNWIRSFDGLSLHNTPQKDWAVKKDGGRFDQFTGATITPRAVVKAIHQGLLFFQDNQRKILAQAAQQQVKP